MSQEVIFENDSDPAESGQNPKQKAEQNLPPLASNGDIKLWLDEDKNGNVFVRIDAPFLESEPIFFHDDLKKGVNQLVEKWEENRA